MEIATKQAVRTQAALEAISPVILSGGSGTRLWPLSRKDHPKQLIRLLTELSPLQETAARTLDASLFAPPTIVTNEAYGDLVRRQLDAVEIEPELIILEPTGRNTAPALAVAALALAERGVDPLLFAEPADHAIGSIPAFRAAIALGRVAAERNWIVAFGVPAAYAEPDYGYIRRGSPLSEPAGVFSIDRFIEKPTADFADDLRRSGAYHWNSGIFLVRASVYQAALRRTRPEMLQCCERAVECGQRKGNVLRLGEPEFCAAASVSIDRAVMEVTDRGAMVPVDMQWSDLGSWRSLRDARQRDADGNVLDGDVVVDGVRNSYVRSESKLVAAVGLDNVVVVSCDDAVLVAAADRAGEIGRLVERLKRGRRVETDRHRRIDRPWGYFQTVDQGARYHVKRIVVNPGERLSLQMHHHRAEHWVVVSGTAKVTKGSVESLVCENESVFIPIGETHRVENPGRVPLQLIEVQTGTYLGEDDIVRFDDVYGRA
jgi:mannose-1-phosphate guanylyltransferase/mannose-6-phosphate isomerase